MRRREFIAGLGGAAAWLVVARAQQPAMPVVGYLGSNIFPPRGTALRDAFLQGLGEAGYTDGRNVAIAYRWVEGHNDRVAGFVGDLVGRHVAVIAAVESTASALAVKAATQTIPIVFRVGGDPVAAGLVPNLNRPGGNITGVTTLGVTLAAKRLETLHQLLPPGTVVALIANPTNANAARETEETQSAARALGVSLVVLHVSSLADIEAASARVAASNIGGLIAAADPFVLQEHDRIIALAARRAIPAIYSERFVSQAGGLMSYAADTNDGFRHAGIYTGRILSGEKPADLPVQLSTKVLLSLNLKVAKALGITFPTALLVRADEVIE
jgi:putative tryptophan/tyrosine transport system substrate-binding protein